MSLGEEKRKKENEEKDSGASICFGLTMKGMKGRGRG